MYRKFFTILLIAFLIAINPTTLLADPVIMIDPDSLERNLLSGEFDESIINVFNNSNENLTFQIRCEQIEQDRDDLSRSVTSIHDRNQTGPSRDGFGDLINEHRVGPTQWMGIAWDGELMWGISGEGGRMIAYDPGEMEIVEEFQFEDQFCGLVYDGETFWTGRISADDELPAVVQLDRNGNQLNNFAVPGSMTTGVTYDGENIWYYSADMENRNFIRELTTDGVHVREINCSDIIMRNMNLFVGLAWVPEHEEGQLWAVDCISGIFYQLNVEGEIPELIQEFQTERRTGAGLEHDGENLWFTGIGDVWYEIDDGIDEPPKWITSEPTGADLEPFGDIDIVVLLDAAGLLTGDYQAVLHFLSNDPARPDVEVPVEMHVTGVPEIEVTWSEDLGWPDMVDWNNGFQDLFTGDSYPVAFAIQNKGTANIEISDIVSGDEVFTIEERQFVIEPGAGTEMMIIMNPEEDGIYESAITIFWNSPDNVNFVIPVRGQASAPPVIDVDLNAIEDVLPYGTSNSHIVTVSNGGAANLRFKAEFEIVAEPENDNRGASVRETSAARYPDRNQGIQELNNVDWLSANPSEGEIPGNQSGEIEVTISTNHLKAGDYEADFILNSNDPETPEFVVNIQLSVVEAPDIGVWWPEEAGWSEEINWSRVYTDLYSGNPYEVIVEIENSGLAVLEVIEIFSDNNMFTAGLDDFTLEPGEMANVPVNFQAEEDETGWFNGVLTIRSNDPDENEIEIEMRAHSALPPIISTEVNMIEDEIEIGDTSEHFFNIFNDGGSSLRFDISHDIIDEPDEDVSNGPLRDELGEEIVSYAVEAGFVSGLAWDGELMWARNSQDQRLLAFDPNAEEIVETIQILAQGYGFAFDGEGFWVGDFNDANVGSLIRLDRQGNFISAIQIAAFFILGIGLDEDGIWIYGSRPMMQQKSLLQFSYGGDFLQEVNCQETLQNAHGCITIVPEHEDGKLWFMNWQTSELLQLNIGEEQLEVIQQVQLPNDQAFGIGHDSENFWYAAGEGNWYVIDDGVSEVSWLTYEPTDGVIEAGDDIEVFVTLNTEDCFLGDYEADIHINSNDPDDPDIVIGVFMSVIEELSVPSVSTAPDNYYFNNSYPNPFNMTTRIAYGLPHTDHIKIAVYDITGQTITTLFSGTQTSGHHTVVWNAGYAAAGRYFIHLESPGFNAIQQVTLLK